LKRNGRLRGCIGNLSDNMPILEGIQLNAIQAAFHDPRFPPLNPEELAELEIEISILSRPKPLEYQSSADLISKLRVNVDGVILSKGFAGATFLPQVWQELPDPEQFLSHLCRKAGLPSDAWRKTPLKVMTYQVRHFDETN
jgi:AmmeMemoRadiSam system protein A